MPSRYKGKESEALNLLIVLSRATRSVQTALQESLASTGLTERQFAVLEALYHLGPLQQKELAEKMLCTPGNLTAILSHLEKTRHIRRLRRPSDRRCYSLVLTEAGKSLIKKTFPLHARRVHQLMSVLSPSEQRTLRALVKRLGLFAAHPTPTVPHEG